jgi:hypothetical protein
VPKGFKFAKKAREEQAARRGISNSMWAGKLIFKLPDSGDSAIVRFLEHEGEVIWGAYHHEIPVEGRAYGDLVPCLARDEETGERTDAHCPGCDADLKEKEKYYVLLIWQDAPVYKTDDKNKIVKDNAGDPIVLDRADQVAIWSSGPRLAENLEEIEEAYNGLTSRPFKVKRKGIKLDTEYIITPEDVDGGPKKMSAAEKKLAEGHDIKLADFLKPPSAEQFEARLSGKVSAGGGSSRDEDEEPKAQRAASSNPFKRK